MTDPTPAQRTIDLEARAAFRRDLRQARAWECYVALITNAGDALIDHECPSTATAALAQLSFLAADGFDAVARAEYHEPPG